MNKWKRLMAELSHDRYMKKIRTLLLAAGRIGVSQYDLNQKTRTKFFALNDLLQVLNEWENRQWVQKFKMRVNGKRPTTMWRATTELVAGFANVHLKGVTPEAEMVDLENPKEPLEIDAFQYRT